MIPAQIDIPCWKNSDYNEEFPVTHEGVPLDIDGIKARLTARRYVTSPDVLFTQNIPVIDGVFKVSIPRATISSAYETVRLTSNDNPIAIVYDILITFTDGVREVWMQGVITIYPGVN